MPTLHLPPGPSALAFQQPGTPFGAVCECNDVGLRGGAEQLDVCRRKVDLERLEILLKPCRSCVPGKGTRTLERAISQASAICAGRTEYAAAMRESAEPDSAARQFAGG